MDSGQLLGSLEVEVKANLDKLVADFARGRTQTQAFANDMQKVTSASKLSAAEQLNLSNAYNSLIKTYDPLKDKMGRYMADAESIRRINASGLFNTKELDRLNQGFSTLAPKSAQTAAGFRTAAGDAAALKMQLGGLVEKYNPLQVAQGKYAQEVALVQKAQAAGMIGQSEAIALQGAMGRAFQDTEKKIEGETVGLEGWARSTEHHVRAMRLLYSFIGGEVVKSLAEFAVKTLEATASIKDQSDQLGITSTQLQEYKAIAGQVGMSADDMAGAFNALNHNIAELELHKGQKQLSDFGKIAKQLGVDITDASGKVRDKTAIFNDFIDKLGQVGDQSQRHAAQLIVFGEAGDKMGQLVEGGSAKVKELRAAVREMGLTLSDQQIQQADETAKKLDLLGQALKIDFARVVVDNAGAIERLATALENVAAISLQRIIQEVGALFARVSDLINLMASIKQPTALDQPTKAGQYDTVGGVPQPTLHNLHKFSEDVGGLDLKSGRATGAIGSALEAVGLQSKAQPPLSITVKLPPAQEFKAKGPNIDLTGALAHHGATKKPKQEKFDEFDADMAREKEQQLQLERDATGNLVRQNEIDHEITDLKLEQQVQQIKRQQHNKELTAGEAKQLIAAAQTTATMEKEAADRKMRIAMIEKQNQYADEIEALMQDGLNIAKVLARTDAERKSLDLQILDSKQRQALGEIDKEIAIAAESKDEPRIAQLTEERKLLLENQVAEIKQFKIEHLSPIEKFKNDLPRDLNEFRDAMNNVRFDLFNQKLQQAAQFAGDIGDAFGTLAGDLISFKNPLDAFRSFIQSLAQTFTKNFVEQPISDWAKDHIGLPLAKRGFGKELNKLAGPDPLTVQQMNTALAQASGSLHGLQVAAGDSGPAIGGITTAATPAATSLTNLTTAASAAATALNSMSAAGGGGGGGGAGSLIGSLLGSGGGGGGGGLDLGSFLLDNSGGDMTDAILGPDLLGTGMYGFSSGGFTGNGSPGDVKGVVHAGEFVMNAGAVKAHGTSFLSSLNSPMPGYVAGGLVGGGMVGNPVVEKSGEKLKVAGTNLIDAAHQLSDAAKALGGGGSSDQKGSGGGLFGKILGVAGGLLPMLALTLMGHKTTLSSGGLAPALLGGGKGFDIGGFTGTGADHEIAGVVHKNEWVWDADTTRQYMPLLKMIGMGRLPTFQGPALGQSLERGGAGRPLNIQFGDLHLHGVRDERSARQSAKQFTGHVHQQIARVVKSGLSQ